MNDLLQPIPKENQIGKDITGLSVLNPIDELVSPMLDAWTQNDIQAAGDFANELQKKATYILTQQSKHLHVYVAIGLSLTVSKGIEGFKEGLAIIQEALKTFPDMYPQLEKKREYEATFFLESNYGSLVKVLSDKTDDADADRFSKILKEAKDISCKIDNSFGTLLCSTLKASSELFVSHSNPASEAEEQETHSVQDITQTNPNEIDWSNFNHESAIRQLRQLKNVFEHNDPYNPVNIALDLALLWSSGKNVNHLLEHREDIAKVAKFVEKLKTQSQQNG